MLTVSLAWNNYWEEISIECLKSVNITKSMDQSSSWEANSSSDSQEFPGVLLKPKVHCRIHKSPPPVPILCQNSAVHAAQFYVFKIPFNIFLTSTLRSSGGLFPSVRPTKILYIPLPFSNVWHIPCAFHTYILSIFIYLFIFHTLFFVFILSSILQFSSTSYRQIIFEDDVFMHIEVSYIFQSTETRVSFCVSQ